MATRMEVASPPRAMPDGDTADDEALVARAQADPRAFAALAAEARQTVHQLLDQLAPDQRRGEGCSYKSGVANPCAPSVKNNSPP